MTQSILAYFKTENDAESARSALQTLKVTNLLVDSIPKTNKDTRYVPMSPIGPTWSVTGTVPLGGLGDEEISQGSDEPMTHLVEAQVEEGDMEEAMKIVMKNNGFKMEE